MAKENTIKGNLVIHGMSLIAVSTTIIFYQQTKFDTNMVILTIIYAIMITILGKIFAKKIDSKTVIGIIGLSVLSVIGIFSIKSIIELFLIIGKLGDILISMIYTETIGWLYFISFSENNDNIIQK